MFWLPCLLPFALLYKVFEYIYRYFFPKAAVAEDAAGKIEEAATCPFSKKTAADGQCPAAKASTTELTVGDPNDTKKD